ncbi:MAG: XRE family transcriptional regulator [Pseudomonadota bacterium]
MAKGFEHAPQLGKALQSVRKSRQLTLADLSERSGVSKSMLSQIERGTVNPTVAVLWNLTHTLGVDIGDFLKRADGQEHDASAHIEHLKDYLTPTISSADGKCVLRILSPQYPLPPAEWYEVIVEAGGELDSDPHIEGTNEHLTVLEGKLEVRLPERSIALGKGETLRYSADKPHCIANPAKRLARAMLVVIQPPPDSSKSLI